MFLYHYNIFVHFVNLSKNNNDRNTHDFYTSLMLTKLTQYSRQSDFDFSQGLNLLIKQIINSKTNF